MTAALDPTNPQLWMQRAHSNLRLAQIGRNKGVVLEDLCFNAQQAAEKAFKAICLEHNIDFPKTHSLVQLIDLLEAAGVYLPEQVKAADVLTQYAVQSRYPGWVEEVTLNEYREALLLAQQVVTWADSLLLGRKA